MPAYHFIAIGGSAMHALAIVLKQNGNRVSGSDDVIFEPSKSKLAQHELLPEQEGWFPDKIDKSLDAVILGMHAKKDNPELKKAHELGLPVYSYPEFLYNQSVDKTRVVIAGSHGKTTITAMILHVLQYWNKDVDYMAGALQDAHAANLKLTAHNDFVVFEGDEYLSSALDSRSKFLHYKPNIALISGIAWDHINVFKTFEQYIDTFRQFLLTITPGGIVVYNQEDPIVKELVENCDVHIRKHPYKTPEFEISNEQTQLITNFGHVPLQIFGQHNLSNLAGAQWICLHMGIDEEAFYEAMATFTGAGKRLEKLLHSKKLILFKDFAHAPSKVRATVKSVVSQFSSRKCTAILELHTYSSLNSAFLPLYKDTLNGADAAIVFYDLEALKIKKMQPLTPDDIRNAFNNENLLVFTNAESIQEYIAKLNPTQDVWLFMSSGNYGGINLPALAKKWS
ncbi:MAG: Mur ligase family protein [Flavobacteriaceae bacterium]|nr:Mur ligase family protein [Flavobacteriaceae bacterium]